LKSKKVKEVEIKSKKKIVNSKKESITRMCKYNIQKYRLMLPANDALQNGKSWQLKKYFTTNNQLLLAKSHILAQTLSLKNITVKHGWQKPKHIFGFF
jgi:hypothetical protein